MVIGLQALVSVFFGSVVIGVVVGSWAVLRWVLNGDEEEVGEGMKQRVVDGSKIQMEVDEQIEDAQVDEIQGNFKKKNSQAIELIRAAPIQTVSHYLWSLVLWLSVYI